MKRYNNKNEEMIEYQDGEWVKFEDLNTFLKDILRRFEIKTQNRRYYKRLGKRDF
jgi:hypothetical protein